MTVNDLINKKLGEKAKLMADIDIRAKKEHRLQETLASIREQWDVNQEVNFSPNQEVEKVDDLFNELDDSLAKVAEVQSSKYAPYFSADTEKWSDDMHYLQKFLIELIQCYRSYN